MPCLPQIKVGMNEPYSLSGMTGGSDFLPFLEVGIPTGGLLTGTVRVRVRVKVMVRAKGSFRIRVLITLLFSSFVI